MLVLQVYARVHRNGVHQHYEYLQRSRRREEPRRWTNQIVDEESTTVQTDTSRARSKNTTSIPAFRVPKGGFISTVSYRPDEKLHEKWSSGC